MISIETFAFTPENLKEAEAQIAKYPPGRQSSAVLALLDLAQRQNDGWLPQAAIEVVAKMLNMPPIRVYELASFYTMLRLKPVGKHHIQVCGTMPCWLRGAVDIRQACETQLGIGEGELTPDGQFSLVEVECLGACINAPVVQINDDFYEDLTPEIIIDILKQMAKGETVQPGSQTKEKTDAFDS